MFKTKTLREPTDFKGRFAAMAKRNLYVWLAFLIPFILMVTAFALMEVSPFGDKQILVTDLWHQYFPFLVDFQNKLQNGESFFWTWSVGGGVNYFSLMSYYLASPVNFLSVFVPSDWLREFLMFSVSLKIALSGAFMAYFLKCVYKRNDATLLICGCSFSFCAFFMGYYWNTIWLDTVCITPLVALGIVKLLTENRFRLYTVMLALSLITNYYIGFFTCIFVLLLFIVYHLMRWQGAKAFFINLVKTGLFSMIAIGLTAFFLLPAFFALQNTHATGSTFPTTFAINIGESNDLLGVLRALKSILGNLINFTCPATKEADAIPNIACGGVAVFFAFLSLTSKSIKLREKLIMLGLVFFMFLSCIIRQLDYIWHGFHFTNMIPYRFSYLISFVIIVMAFRAFMNIETVNLLGALISSALSFFVLLLALDDKGTDIMFKDHMDWITPTIAASAIIFGFITIIVLLYTKRIIPKNALIASMLIVSIAQSGFTAYCGVNRTMVTTTIEYPRGEETTAELIDAMYQLEDESADLWRAEVTSTQTLNDGALNGYHGLSMFNSMSNESMTQFFENFGMMGWKSGNRYTYAEGSPVTNTFMNLKYLILRDDVIHNTYDLTEVRSINNEKLYSNNHYLPMGFMVNKGLENWTENENEDQFNPFDKQNEFFRAATGIAQPVYTALEVETQGHSAEDVVSVNKTAYGEYSFRAVNGTAQMMLKWNYTAPKDGLYMMYADVHESDDITVAQNGVQQNKKYQMSRPYIASIGYFSKGDKISVIANPKAGSSGTARVYVDVLNAEVFEQGYQQLSAQTLRATESSSNSLKGDIIVYQDGLFYTSIPYEEGWTAKVDGEPVEIIPVGGSLVAFELGTGQHEIELVYYPKGFWPGLAVTVTCMLAFALICFLVYKKKKRLLPDETYSPLSFPENEGYEYDEPLYDEMKQLPSKKKKKIKKVKLVEEKTEKKTEEIIKEEQTQ